MVTDPVLNSVASPSSSRSRYDWLEPPESPSGVFATHPQVKTWCRDHLWISNDHSVSLIFDIQSIDASGDPETAMTICADVQEVSEELVKNAGRLLIIGNDCHGSNRLFGNVKIRGSGEAEGIWPTRLSIAYNPNSDSFTSIGPIPKDIRWDIPATDTKHLWRRLM